MSRWRWDQGRLDYFSVESLRKIAAVFVDIDGTEDTDPEYDPLREPLVLRTELPFSPDSYKVWRNYARVIKLSLIASRIDGRYHCTDIAKSLVSGEMASDADSYLLTLAKRTFYPSPAFEGFDASLQRVYPMLAIIKVLLTGRFDVNGLSARDVCSVLVGNNVTGLEGLEFYSSIGETSRAPEGDELRQINEMMKVMSQISFLFWQQGHLFIDPSVSASSKTDLYQLLSPDEIVQDLPEEPDAAILIMGSLDSSTVLISEAVDSHFVKLDEDSYQSDATQTQQTFQEGRRRLINHYRVERNRKLREQFLSSSSEPDRCDMCRKTSHIQYPWVNSLIEVHHKLPLASTVRVQGNSTLLNDLVGLCPSCHKAIHQYYRNFLRDEGKSDFTSKEEANEVYECAKSLYTSTDV
ncbi:TPA: HNH endonuclease [Escherichia coli]|uniref:HNH endonuclease n=1 Tax=Enterobacterales TaxID=91347 RepID=UPI001907B07B|nr:HNH endonuclease [Citrobacter freundii]MBJ9365900.1 HNH endonuclease [Citrobacter freundii]HDS8560151.1 HNH endonuclease [Klebsiella pneumoniae]